VPISAKAAVARQGPAAGLSQHGALPLWEIPAKSINARIRVLS